MTIIVLLLLLGIIYFLFFFNLQGKAVPQPAPKQATSTVNTLPATTTPVAVQTAIKPNPNAPAATSDDVQKTNLQKEAASFAERLGSYSNQSDYGNITDLKVEMTASMQKWADAFAAAAEKNNDPSTYQGVTTIAVSEEIKDYSDVQGKADFLVHTQKIDSAADGTTATYNQDILITFVKQNGHWLVDNAKWLAKK